MPCQISTADEIVSNGKSAFIAFFNEEIVYAWIGDGTMLKVGKETVIEGSEWSDHAIARDI